MEKGIIIGTAVLYDNPAIKFWIVNCKACGMLFHVADPFINIECMVCHKELTLLKEGK